MLFIGFITTIILPACGSAEKKTDTNPVQTTKQEYQCPMKCTEEIFNKPGVCPECGMELEKISKS